MYASLKFYEIKLQSFNLCHYADLFLHLFMAHEYLINNGNRVSYLKIKSTYRIKKLPDRKF